ncbi:MAG: glycosyltransferase family 2 protein [Proteobacteria bacterium]|nr:glycosyltransferase family 2 protein [Pseudomonadota bacterium]
MSAPLPVPPGDEELPIDFSLFIPFFDERESLPGAVEEALRMLRGLDLDTELVLVDDGSSDGSEETARRYAEQNDDVRLVRHETNGGYGAALCTGFAACTGDIVSYSDADLPVAMHHFADRIALLGDCDLVAGYPLGWHKSVRRRIYTAGYKLLVRVLLGVAARDINFSFKLVRRDLLERMRLDARTGLIDAQLLAEAVRLSARIEQVEVPYQERRHGESHFDSPAVAWANGVELVQLWRRMR